MPDPLYLRRETFLDEVHRQVIRIGPREHIAVERLLGSRGEWSHVELRAALASLLSTNEEQWDGVGRIFDQNLARGDLEPEPGLPRGPMPTRGERTSIRLDPPRPGRGALIRAQLRRWIGRGVEAVRNAPRPLLLVAIPLAMCAALGVFVGTQVSPTTTTTTAPPATVPSTLPPKARYQLRSREAAREIETAPASPSGRESEWLVLLLVTLASAPLGLLGARFLRLPRLAGAAAAARARTRQERVDRERERLDEERAEAGHAVRVQYHVERTPALSRQTILDSAELLGRVFRLEPSLELDADATLRRTIAAAGRFSPALATRRDRQEVLVLVDVERGDHPWLGAFVQVLDTWRRLGVRLLRYDYQNNLAESVVDAETTRGFKLEDLARRTEGLPLIVFSRKLSSESRTGESRWLQQAREAWPLAGWIDPYPRSTGELEAARQDDIDRLAERGFLRRYPMTDKNVVALARWLADGGQSLPDVCWEPLGPLPALDESSLLAAALRHWALAGSLVPDPTWDQLEAIRLHFPEIRAALPERRSLQLLLEWVGRETGEDPEADDGRGLDVPEPVQDRWLRKQREREEADPAERGFERRARQLLIDQLASTRPESGELDQQWWDFKRSMHEAILDPRRAHKLLDWVSDKGIAEDALRWVALELRRHDDALGAGFGRAARDALSALVEATSKVSFHELWWGHRRAWLTGALACAGLLAGHTLAGWSGAHTVIGSWIARGRTVTARLPATYEVRDLAVSETVVTENGGVELVLIPGGSFTMGSAESEEGRDPDEGPPHRVTVPAFYLGRYEVTNEEYGRFLAANPDVPKPGYWRDLRFNGARQPHPVGQKAANDWGLYDVLGNVWEWVWDWYGDYPKGCVQNPRGPDRGVARVIRGGSWLYVPQDARVANRYRYEPSFRLDFLGFRLARSLPSGS